MNDSISEDSLTNTASRLALSRNEERESHKESNPLIVRGWQMAPLRSSQVLSFASASNSRGGGRPEARVIPGRISPSR